MSLEIVPVDGGDPVSVPAAEIGPVTPVSEAEPVAAVEAESVAPVEETDKPAEIEKAEDEPEKAEEAAEEKEAEESPEASEEKVPEGGGPEPVTFDTELPATELLEQIKPVLDKYDLEPELQAAIDALTAKAQVQPLAEFADYGEPEAVKTLLERQSYLETSREENGIYRPNTDKFAESIDPARAGWLYFDLGQRQSSKYTGYNQFQELLIDGLALDGDTTKDVLTRYETFMDAMRTNTLPASATPSFIPNELREAYARLSAQSRQDIELLDAELPDDVPLIKEKLAELQLIQRGIQSERLNEQRQAQEAAQQREMAENEAYNLQTNFFSNFRNQFTKDLEAKVQFSADPKMQKILAAQHVALLVDGLDDGHAGEWARAALAEAGAPLDYAQGQKLLKEIERTSVDFTRHKLAVNEKGEPLNPVELNKAARAFETAGKNLTAFAQQVLEKEARFTSTGKAEEVKKEVAKIKVAPKARPVPKSTTPKSLSSEPLKNPHPFGTAQYHEWWIDQEMAAQRAAAGR